MRKKGFTLVELLVVMAILGILAAITLANFTTSQAKGRDAQRKSDLRQISNALEAYYTDHGSYPVGVAGKIMACGCATQNPCVYRACSWGGTSNREFLDGNNTVYMKEIPNDPVSPRQYYYVSTDGKSYGLYSSFENPNDVDCLIKAGSSCTSVFTVNNINYVYGVSSSNTTPLQKAPTGPGCLEGGAVCSRDSDCCNNTCKDRGGGIWLCDQ